jgi:hypothetical protein
MSSLLTFPLRSFFIGFFYIRNFQGSTYVIKEYTNKRTAINFCTTRNEYTIHTEKQTNEMFRKSKGLQSDAHTLEHGKEKPERNKKR